MASSIYIGKMMQVTERVVAWLPMFGDAATSWSATPYYPWLLSRSGGGGKAHKWWHKIQNYKTTATVSGTETISGNPVVFSVTNLTLARDGFYNDERDRTLATQYLWDGSDSQPTQNFVNRLYLFTDDVTASGGTAAPGPNYFLTDTHIAPAFLWEGLFDDNAANHSVSVRSYPAGGHTQVGGGYLDGEPFDAYVQTEIPGTAWTVNSVDINIEPLLYYSHDGRYDTATGLPL